MLILAVVGFLATSGEADKTSTGKRPAHYR
jgi:hypothetical protein